MSEAQVLAYVRATAALLALPLDEARVQAVALHLGRTVAMARLLDAADLAPEDELAEIYRPAPFPPQEGAA
ncbi:MAG TPA: AtzG-like protein [Ramlibacter sp.]